MNIFVEGTLLVFLFITVLFGGGAALVSGRALAKGWRPVWQVIVYMLLLAFVTRFFHFSLFDGKLLSLQYYVTDGLILVVLGLLGYRLTRTQQMVTQYRWLYRRTGPLTWTKR
ncbi:MAG: DUF6867 family protein [Methyloligellaceae bacterium]